MSPEEIVAYIRRSKSRCLVYRVNGEVAVAKHDSSLVCALDVDPNAEFIGAYTSAAPAEWIAEDLSA